ncbi:MULTISPECIES: hypothetical protein [unclassified Spirosoma]|uniref:hypothetical protein n=1 Tax=unclassified Spirosoma TaxID=2621999 RepID=UPI00095F5594|nr:MULTISPECIES: hypothetical protein [unclassified Spirosoma]MBN8823955.1 hypothetical protein [Spirosoma sp.]OJW70368.1 MAG: hypothetical protein BGO59_24200 [Spirosoma sp. 48-14]
MDANEEKSIDKSWEELLDQLAQVVGKRPADLNAVLFLIGVQELGTGPKRFSKEAKQDLMHVAVCRVLSLSGYYTLEGYDQDGWPQWSLAKPIPHGDLLTQEIFLKQHVIHYFETLFV